MNFSKTIVSLAILKVNWDNRRTDYIDTFILFVCHLIQKNCYESFDIRQIKDDFYKEFGLSLPFHVMRVIMSRVKKRGFVRTENQRFFSVKDKISECNFAEVCEKQERKLTKVVSEFIKFVKNNFDKELNLREAEEAFLGFVDAEDIASIFAPESQEKIFPPISKSHSSNYLVGRFVQYAKENEPTLFKFVVAVVVGRLLAHTVLFKESSEKVKLKGLKCYLDVGFLFALFETNGAADMDAYYELVQNLQECDIETYVFRHTFEECIGILDRDIYWLSNLNNHIFSIEKASRTLKYFINNDYTESDVEMIINSAEQKLESYGIKIVEKPNVAEDHQCQIDEKALEKIIIETYKENLYFHEDDLIQETINRDVDSISAIYALRKGKKYLFLKDAKHIFVTTNASLAKAINRFENKDQRSSYISASVHDVFIGTFIWLQSPTKINDINEKKLMAQVYAALQPDDALVKKYLIEIEKLKDKKEISSKQYYLLRSSGWARQLLQRNTIGDSNNLTSKTPVQILEEMRDKASKVERQKYEKERKEYREAILQRDKMISERRKTSKKIKQISTGISWLLISPLAIVFLLGFILDSFSLLSPLLVIVFFFPQLFGINLLDLQKKLNQCIKRKIKIFLLIN